MIRTAVFGGGRIGKKHIENIAKYIPDAEISYLVTPHLTEDIVDFSQRNGVKKLITEWDEPFNDKDLDCIIVGTPSATHCELVKRACDTGKAVFCEKPMGLDLEEVVQCKKYVEDAGIPFMVGFVRRYRFGHVHEKVASGCIGSPEYVYVNSRNAKNYSEKYVARSGGMFVDMIVHDFDTSSYMVNSEIEEVYARSECLADPIFAKYNDVDTTTVSVKYKNGNLGMLVGCQRGWFFDQRVEVLGSNGVIWGIVNGEENIDIRMRTNTPSGDLDDYSHIDHENNAFAKEMKDFYNMLRTGGPSPITAYDGLRSVVAAYAANKSKAENRPVKLSEIYDLRYEKK